jgi:hypothetical protein
VLKINGFPAGKTELDPKTEPLKQIRIEATKPKANGQSSPSGESYEWRSYRDTDRAQSANKDRLST